MNRGVEVGVGMRLASSGVDPEPNISGAKSSRARIFLPHFKRSACETTCCPELFIKATDL